MPLSSEDYETKFRALLNAKAYLLEEKKKKDGFFSANQDAKKRKRESDFLLYSREFYKNLGNIKHVFFHYTNDTDRVYTAFNEIFRQVTEVLGNPLNQAACRELKETIDRFSQEAKDLKKTNLENFSFKNFVTSVQDVLLIPGSLFLGLGITLLICSVALSLVPLAFSLVFIATPVILAGLLLLMYVAINMRDNHDFLGEKPIQQLSDYVSFITTPDGYDAEDQQSLIPSTSSSLESEGTPPTSTRDFVPGM